MLNTYAWLILINTHVTGGSQQYIGFKYFCKAESNRFNAFGPNMFRETFARQRLYMY